MCVELLCTCNLIISSSLLDSTVFIFHCLFSFFFVNVCVYYITILSVYRFITTTLSWEKENLSVSISADGCFWFALCVCVIYNYLNLKTILFKSLFVNLFFSSQARLVNVNTILPCSIRSFSLQISFVFVSTRLTYRQLTKQLLFFFLSTHQFYFIIGQAYSDDLYFGSVLTSIFYTYHSCDACNFWLFRFFFFYLRRVCHAACASKAWNLGYFFFFSFCYCGTMSREKDNKMKKNSNCIYH